MQIQWNGSAPTMVRLAINEPKVEVEPGGTVEVDDEEYARFLLNYHRGVMVEVAEDAPAMPDVAEKDLPQRANTALTKKERKTKRA